MKKAIFPGTFDPFTLGHLDILNRSTLIFDEIIIGIGINRDKRTMFNIDQRIDMIESIIKDNNKTLVGGGIVADLGVSSFQLDNSKRGFSFNKDGPLDMRMSGEGVTAQELIYSLDEKELARILWDYGDEEKSRAIAKMIMTKVVLLN